MFCSNCGKEVTESMKFCANCGAPIICLTQAPPPAPTQIPTVTPVRLAPVPKKFPTAAIVTLTTLITLAIAIVIFLNFFFIRITPGNDAPGTENPSANQGELSDKTQNTNKETGSEDPPDSSFDSSSDIPSSNSRTTAQPPEEPPEESTDTPTQSKGVVTVNGNAAAADDTEFIYTYLEENGHHFATVFIYGGDVFYFTAMLPEELCVSGAEYSGNDISANHIRFDAAVSRNGFPEYYNSVNDPQAFDELKISIINIDLYRSVEFRISGTVFFDDQSEPIIQAYGKSEYTVSTSGY